MHHPTERITNITHEEHWLEREITQWVSGVTESLFWGGGEEGGQTVIWEGARGRHRNEGEQSKVKRGGQWGRGNGVNGGCIVTPLQWVHHEGWSRRPIAP